MMTLINKMIGIGFAGVLAVTMVGCDDGGGGATTQAPATIEGVTLNVNPEITFNANGTFAYNNDDATSDFPVDNVGNAGDWYFSPTAQGIGVVELVENGNLDLGGGVQLRLSNFVDTDADGYYDNCTVEADGSAYDGTFAEGAKPVAPDSQDEEGDDAGYAPATRGELEERVGDGYILIEYSDSSETEVRLAGGTWDETGGEYEDSGSYTYRKLSQNSGLSEVDVDGEDETIRVTLMFSSDTTGTFNSLSEGTEDGESWLEWDSGDFEVVGSQD